MASTRGTRAPVTCPDCGQETRGIGAHRRGNDCLAMTVQLQRKAEGLVPIAVDKAGMLDRAGIAYAKDNYRWHKGYINRPGSMQMACYVPPWVASIVMLLSLPCEKRVRILIELRDSPEKRDAWIAVWVLSGAA